VTALPAIAPEIRQKITEHLKLPSLEEAHKNSTLWKVGAADSSQNFIYANEPRYRGEVPTGLCTIYLLDNNNLFAGFFRGNVTHSCVRENKGAFYVFPNGDQFFGDQVKNDFGVYIGHTNEYRYEGDWKNCRPHGIGKEETQAGLYEGYFLNGKKHGEGKFTFRDGLVYEGNFANN
jgi:hypothetical protein